MKTLNRRDFPGAQYPERIIQFGEGNFLRAFVDWQLDLLNEHTDLNAGVVIVRPIESAFPPSLSTQDGLYTTIIRGLNEQGDAVSEARLIRSVNREISVYADYDAFLQLAHNPEMRFVFSNTTEAGISYHAGDRLHDTPFPCRPMRRRRGARSGRRGPPPAGGRRKSPAHHPRKGVTWKASFAVRCRALPASCTVQ